MRKQAFWEIRKASIASEPRAERRIRRRSLAPPNPTFMMTPWGHPSLVRNQSEVIYLKWSEAELVYYRARISSLRKNYLFFRQYIITARARGKNNTQSFLVIAIDVRRQLSRPSFCIKHKGNWGPNKQHYLPNSFLDQQPKSFTNIL